MPEQDLPKDLFSDGGLPSDLFKDESPSFISTLGKSITDTLNEHPYVKQGLQRLLTGFSNEDIKNIPIDPLTGAKRQLPIGDIPSEQSILPALQHPSDESWPGYLARGAYNQLIRPLGSPAGLLGASAPGKLPESTVQKTEEVLPKLTAEAPKIEPKITPEAKLPEDLFIKPPEAKPNFINPFEVKPQQEAIPEFGPTTGKLVDEANPAMARGDIPKPPLDILHSKMPPETPQDTIIPPPGQAKPLRDINNPTAEFGSVNQVLSTREETKPIADIITRSQDDKMKWIAQTERELSSLSAGLNKQDRQVFGRILNGEQVEGVNPTLVERAKAAREVLDSIHEQIPAGAKWSGEDIGYLDNYLTHIMKEGGDDVGSAIKNVFDYHFGTKSPLFRLFERPYLSAEPGSKEVIYGGRGTKTPSSPFAETRTGQLGSNIEYDVNKIFPAYVESIAKVIFDKPAIAEAKSIIDKLPDSRLKELSGWYLKNYTRYDALPGLTEAWNSLAGQVARTTSRSLLGFNTGLQSLHVARLVGNMWPELGTKYSTIGLAKVASQPIQAWNEAARLGLLYNEVRPFAFKTAMEKYDSMANLFSVADYLDKAIGYHGFKAKFMAAGLPEEEASARALSETKRVSMTVDPSRVTKFFGHDEGAWGATKQLALQYKQIPTKIAEQYIRIAMNAKQNPAAAIRLTTGVSALIAAHEAGAHVFHLGYNLVPTDLWGAFGSAAKQVSNDLRKGDWESALMHTAEWVTPSGKSVTRQLDKGLSMFEPGVQ